MPLQDIVRVDPDLDGKGSISHVEATVLSSDPRVALLQSEIEELLQLSQEEYEIVHRRLVRKVSCHGVWKLTTDRHSTLASAVCAPSPQLSGPECPRVSLFLCHEVAVP